jgi:threonine/homoserine/homoserine lactone efflux protein
MSCTHPSPFLRPYTFDMTIVIPSRLWEYALAAFLIILAPGPSVLFTIARAIAWGRATALLTVLGNVLGMYTMSIFVCFGLGPILSRSHLIFNLVQWGGGAYLIYLGASAIRDSPRDAVGMKQVVQDRPTPAATIRQGFMVGALNPKGMVFFAAIVPQFVDRAKGSITSQMILLATIFAAIALLSDGSWGLLAGTVREWFARDIQRLIRMRMSGGIVMILLGIFTIAQSLLPLLKK